MFHLGTFDNFKHYYLHFIRIYLKRDFPDAVSYNRFVELESRVFFKMRAQGDEVNPESWTQLKGSNETNF